MPQNKNPVKNKLTVSELNAIDKKELLKRVETLANRKSCRHFSHKEIELLLLSHWGRIKQRQDQFGQLGVEKNNPLVVLHPLLSSTRNDNGAGGQGHWWNRGLNRIEFFDFLHKVFGLTDKDLLPQIFTQFDTNKSGQIEDMEWVECLAVLLRGTLEDKIHYAFAVYDTNGDGFIARDEMHGMLKQCIARPSNEEDIDEAIKDIVEIVLKLMDKDHDMKVSKMDFRKSVRNEPLLLEAFGPVLPDEELIENYQNEIFAEIIENDRIIQRSFANRKKSKKWRISGPNASISTENLIRAHDQRDKRRSIVKGVVGAIGKLTGDLAARRKSRLFND